MKKVVLTMSLVVLVLCSSPVLAAGTFTSTGYSGDGTTVDLGMSVLSQFTTSTNVTLSASSDDSQYAALSGHQQGNHQYATTLSPLIFWTQKVVGETITSLSSSSATQFNSWSSL